MAEERPGSLFLLDGMSLAFRAFFALPPDLATSEGLVTNAVHGFASMLLSIVRDHGPSGLAVAFDLPGETFRDALVDDYKGGRGETPPELLPQFDLIRELVGVLGIPLVALEGYEADDVLATLASRRRDEGGDVVVVTGDRDCFQLVEDPHIRVLYNKRGVSDYALYDEAGILERTGLDSKRYPMLAALRGDPSDNLPGVPGVGEKTAAKLLTTYGDLDGIFSHLSELTPKLRENLAANEQRARTNFDVMTLVRETPLTHDPADLHMGGWDRQAAADFFERLEMRNLWKRTLAALDAGQFGPAGPSSASRDPGGPSQPAAPARAEPTSPVPSNRAPDVSVVHGATATKMFNSLATTPHLVALNPAKTQLASAAPLDGVVGVVPIDGASAINLLSGTGPIGAVDAKEVLRLCLAAGADPAIPFGDASVAGYLLDAAAGTYSLDALLARYLPGEPAPKATVPSGQLDLGGDVVAADLARATVLVGVLLAAMEPALDAEGMGSLYREIELPLIRVLARMEDRGICVDVKVLRTIAEDLTARTEALEQQVQELAGHPFTVNSTKQLQEVLFVELGLTPGKKTKTGFSTDASVLEGLLGEHPIIDAILRYRELEKLRSTYGEALLNEVAADGRIHATFRQTVARTGRLSSEAPNLHNIPVRSEEGRRFRDAFVPAKGWRLLVADYDQIELRIIAHLSEDQGLVAAFEAGEDIHRSIAAGVFGVTAANVTHEQRERAKMVTYGLAYGMEAFGLARRLGSDVAEAKGIMDAYFAAFPGVKRYMDAAVVEAAAQGFTRTELGRVRPLPELHSSNRNVRLAAERQAMNAGIQGLAADIFKVALVRLDHRLSAEGLEARIVLQVHDEVLVEAPSAEEAAVEIAVIEELQGAAGLAVPLKISLGWGASWGGAKG